MDDVIIHEIELGKPNDLPEGDSVNSGIGCLGAGVACAGFGLGCVGGGALCVGGGLACGFLC